MIDRRRLVFGVQRGGIVAPGSSASARNITATMSGRDLVVLSLLAGLDRNQLILLRRQ